MLYIFVLDLLHCNYAGYFTLIEVCLIYRTARGRVVGGGTMLPAGRSRVPNMMRRMDFFSNLPNLPATL
jgi:hypothetical protein